MRSRFEAHTEFVFISENDPRLRARHIARSVEQRTHTESHKHSNMCIVWRSGFSYIGSRDVSVLDVRDSVRFHAHSIRKHIENRLT